MRPMTFLRTALSVCLAVALVACRSGGPVPAPPTIPGVPNADDIESQLPTECSLPPGVVVTNVALNESQAGNLAGQTGYDVTMTLNRALRPGETAIACYVVRDRDVVLKVIAGGFVGFLPGQGRTVTREDSFLLNCDGRRDVVGAQPSPYDSLNASSNERSTNISVQHVVGISSLDVGVVNLPTGINGPRSSEMRVTCP